MSLSTAPTATGQALRVLVRRNTEDDLTIQYYNVYRSVDGGVFTLYSTAFNTRLFSTWTELNSADPPITPWDEFRDTNVVATSTYAYKFAAVVGGVETVTSDATAAVSPTTLPGGVVLSSSSDSFVPRTPRRLYLSASIGASLTGVGFGDDAIAQLSIDLTRLFNTDLHDGPTRGWPYFETKYVNPVFAEPGAVAAVGLQLTYPNGLIQYLKDSASDLSGALNMPCGVSSSGQKFVSFGADALDLVAAASLNPDLLYLLDGEFEAMLLRLRARGIRVRIYDPTRVMNGYWDDAALLGPAGIGRYIYAKTDLSQDASAPMPDTHPHFRCAELHTARGGRYYVEAMPRRDTGAHWTDGTPIAGGLALGPYMTTVRANPSTYFQESEMPGGAAVWLFVGSGGGLPDDFANASALAPVAIAELNAGRDVIISDLTQWPTAYTSEQRAAIISAASPPTGGTVSSKSAIFNNGVSLSQGLSWSFARNNATKQFDGSARTANAERWARPRLLTGAITAAPITHFDPGGFCELFDIGFNSAGDTSLYLVRNSTDAQMHLWSGDFSGDGSFFDMHNQTGTGSSRPDAHITALRTAGATTDLFKQQPSQTAYTDECWCPIAGAVCYGLIAIFCQVYKCATADDHTVAANWKGQHVGIAFCKASSWLSSPGTGFFTSPPSSPQLHALASGNIGTGWGFQWDVLDKAGTPPLKAWIHGVDYQNHPDSQGGIAFVCPIARSSITADDWTADEVAQTCTLPTPTTLNVRHTHQSVIIRSGALGITQWVSSGDGALNAAISVEVLSTEGNATAHDTSYRDGATVPAGARAWRTGAFSNWTFAPVTGSSSGIDNGALATLGAYDNSGGGNDNSAINFRGNQFVTAYAKNPTTIIGTTDENSDALWKATVPAQGTGIKFDPLWTPQRVRTIPPVGSPSLLAHYWVSFYLDPRSRISLNSGFAANLCPSVGAPFNLNGARILWSPDGDAVCPIYPHGISNLHALHTHNGRIYYGTQSQIKSIAEPTFHDTVRPLQIGPGGVNYRDTDNVAAPSDTTSGQAVITAVTGGSIPANFPGMRTTVYHITHTGASTTNCISWRLTETLPDTAKWATVRLWLYNTPPASRADGKSGALNPSFTVNLSDSGGANNQASGALLNNYNITHGEWFPVTLRLYIPALLHASHTPGAPATLRLGVALTVDNGQTGPLDFYIAEDSITIADNTTGDDNGGYPLNLNATGNQTNPDEVAIISGFNAPIASDWTLAAVLHIPREALWDDMHALALYSYDPSNPTFTIAGDGLSVTLSNATTSGKAIDDYYNNMLLRAGDTDDSGLSGIRITDYVGATKVATLATACGVTGAQICSVFAPLRDSANGIDRPRLLLSLLTEDSQEGILLFLTMSRTLAGTNARSLGAVRVTAGAIDWGTFFEVDSNEYPMVGDTLHIALVNDSIAQTLSLHLGVSGAPGAFGSDAGSLYFSFAGTEIFTKVRLGGLTTVHPLDITSIYLSDDAESAASLNTKFGNGQFGTLQGDYRPNSRAVRRFRRYRS